MMLRMLEGRQSKGAEYCMMICQCQKCRPQPCGLSSLRCEPCTGPVASSVCPAAVSASLHYYGFVIIGIVLKSLWVSYFAMIALIRWG
jgi:hypothetical protein